MYQAMTVNDVIGPVDNNNEDIRREHLSFGLEIGKGCLGGDRGTV